MELNDNYYDETDLHEAPKSFEKSAIKLMRYYPDNDGVCYLFENHGRYVYEDWIEDPKEVLERRKKSNYAHNIVGSSFDLSPSSDGLLSVAAKSYFNEWFSKILDESQDR